MSFADEFEELAEEDPVYEDAGHEARVRLSLEVRSLRAGGGEEIPTDTLKEIVDHGEEWDIYFTAVDRARTVLAERRNGA